MLQDYVDLNVSQLQRTPPFLSQASLNIFILSGRFSGVHHCPFWRSAGAWRFQETPFEYDAGGHGG